MPGTVLNARGKKSVNKAGKIPVFLTKLRWGSDIKQNKLYFRLEG